MSAAQISLWSYIFDFLGQILSNMFWLKLPTTLDDYIAMVLIFTGMYVSVYKILGYKYDQYYCNITILITF